MRLACCLLVLALLPAMPAGAQAPVPLRPCMDEEQPAPARVDACTRFIEATGNALSRSQALIGRAQARMDILGAQENVDRAAYDSVIADLDASYDIIASERALALRAVARFFRGDVAPGVMPLFRAGEWEQAVRRVSAMLARDPRNVDLLLLRSTFRALTGDGAGAQQDRSQAVRIAVEARR